jgi:hypothetical protein
MKVPSFLGAARPLHDGIRGICEALLKVDCWYMVVSGDKVELKIDKLQIVVQDYLYSIQILRITYDLLQLVSSYTKRHNAP